MKSISSPSLFHLPRGRNRRYDGAGSLTGLYGSISRTTSRSVVAISAKKSKKQPPSTGSNSPPPRITSNLKHNLPILRDLKELEKKKSATRLPSRYRRKRVDKKEAELSDDPPTTLDSMDSDIEEKEELPNVLFVDGYNVCGYWPKLKTEFMSGKLEIARQMLIKEMTVFSGMNEMEVVVVFDATKSGHCTRRENYAGVAVVYSSETSADFWIDSEVKRLIEGECADVTVATSDRAVMNNAFYKGASVWSCETLISEIEDARKEMELSNKKSSILSKHGSLLKNTLGPGVVDGLKDLKKTLLFKEMERRTQLAREKSLNNGSSSKNNRRPKVKLSRSKINAMDHEARLKFDLIKLKPGFKYPTEPGEYTLEEIMALNGVVED